MRMIITRVRVCNCACSSRALGQSETCRLGGGRLPEVMRERSRTTCLAWHGRQICRNLHLKKEHSALFQRLHTSPGEQGGVGRLAAGLPFAVRPWGWQAREGLPNNATHGARTWHVPCTSQWYCACHSTRGLDFALVIYLHSASATPARSLWLLPGERLGRSDTKPDL